MLRASVIATKLDVVIECSWRGPFNNIEMNALHAEAFETRVFDESEWNWVELTNRDSMGWVTARRSGELVGFLNVVWDGLVHAWIQDLIVAASARHQGIGVRLVEEVRSAAKGAGCEFLHVDFDDDLRSFYYDACCFRPTNGGLIELT